MLSQEQIRQFYENGYCVIRGVVSEAHLPKYREAYERMVNKVKKNPSTEYGTRFIKNEANLTAKQQGLVREDEVWGCNALLHPDLYETEFTHYLNNEKLLSSLSSILGPDLRVAGLKAIWSPVYVDYDLIWHRDGPDDMYSEDGSQEHIQFNTALNRDASFRVVKGSHLRPLTEQEKAQARTGVDPLPDEDNPVLEPGDVLFMHSKTFHRGSAPKESARRTLHYIIASTDKVPDKRDLARYRSWYDTNELDQKLQPTAGKLFDNLFSWEGIEIADSNGDGGKAY